MVLNELHFAYPLWLLALLVIPIIWGLFFFYFRGQKPIHQLEKFIDKHLIPFLLLGGEQKKKRIWTQLLFWSIVWSCLVFALAGPRWNFREIDTYTRDQSLAILLDLSESMNAKDISPSRLGRAKQKIEDLLNQSNGAKVGLIVFAADPHMIVPMTEDKETIRHLLPSLDTDLVYVQGSKLAPALEMGAVMLENEPGTNKAMLVISDGGFEDASAIHTAKSLAERGIVLYTIGVGSQEGAPLKDRKGNVIKKNGSPIISKLEKEKFREISNIGHGRYFDADHSERVTLIFDDLEKKADVQQQAHKIQRIWEEQFYLFLLPVLPFFLLWYRRGYIFACLLVLLMPIYSEASLKSYFYNGEQQASQSFEDGDFTSASEAFQDPYRKGVAYYRSRNYEAAEEMFRQSTRPEVASSAGYNLGNALVQQNKLQEAIEAYEDVLKKWPDHKEAKENLELVKKMLEQQKQQNQQDEKDQQDQQKNDQSQENKSDQNNKQNQQQQDQKDQSKNDSSSAEEKDNKDQKQDEAKDKGKDNSKESSKKSEKEKEPQQMGQDEKRAQKQPKSSEEGKAQAKVRSQEDLDADLWLNQIKNNPKSFLKNKFYLESKKNGTKEEVDPW